MSAIIVMLSIVVLSVILVSGKKAFLSLLSLVSNLVSIVLVIWLLTKGFPLFVVIVLFGAVSLIGNFFMFNADIDAHYTKVAFLAASSVIGLFSLLLPRLVPYFYAHGFASEELEELAGVSFDVWVNFQNVFIVMVVVAMIGAVMDGAIAVTAAMSELEEQQPLLSKKELFQSGRVIGQDIIATTMTTLLLAFFGNYLGILLFVLDFKYDLHYLLNAQLIVSQLVVMVFSVLGTLLILPLSAYLYVRLRKGEKQ